MTKSKVKRFRDKKVLKIPTTLTVDYGCGLPSCRRSYSQTMWTKIVLCKKLDSIDQDRHFIQKSHIKFVTYLWINCWCFQIANILKSLKRYPICFFKSKQNLFNNHHYVLFFVPVLLYYSFKLLSFWNKSIIWM